MAKVPHASLTTEALDVLHPKAQGTKAAERHHPKAVDMPRQAPGRPQDERPAVHRLVITLPSGTRVLVVSEGVAMEQRKRGKNATS